jgi:hypothetical protein
MVRNATKYYFPIKESILSILPIVDEFIVALGNCDPNDKTRKVIESIKSDKIKIFERIWSEKDFKDGKIFALETTFALSQCNSDWCFYLQADEVIHENDLPLIKNVCEKFQNSPQVDGFLLRYHHFFGDYMHYLPFHGWYKREIRIVRNYRNIYSYKDAQSFRKNENEKLNVWPIEARIYHYGWVRPPHLMQSKKKEQDSIHNGQTETEVAYEKAPISFEFGTLGKLPIFKGSHPKVMEKLISEIFWQNHLNYTKSGILKRQKMKHEKLKYRIITTLENFFNNGNDIFGYKNWNILKK